MFLEVIYALNEGFIKSFELFIVTLLGALPLGLVICFMAMCKIRVVSFVSKLVIWIVRGTPLMLQLLVIYYGPGLLFGNNVWGSGSKGRFVAVAFAFIFNYACYFAEIYRGGISSISSSQYEAGKVLGLSNTQIFFKIIFLQVIKRILAPLSNEFITLVKDTSLSRTIAVYEIVWAGQAFIKSKGLIWPLFFTGIYYLLFNGFLTIAFAYAEKKLDYFRG